MEKLKGLEPLAGAMPARPIAAASDPKDTEHALRKAARASRVSASPDTWRPEGSRHKPDNSGGIQTSA